MDEAMQQQLQAAIDQVKAESYDAIMQSNRALNQLAQENQALKQRGDALHQLINRLADVAEVDMESDTSANDLFEKIKELAARPKPRAKKK